MPNIFLLIIGLLGGLALFLYGMNMMSNGLNKAAGSKIRSILNNFTKNRYKAFLTGTISTTLIQSSSAVSVMIISLVKAKLLTFPQTFGVLLGAGIGTTITAQIIAFKITDYSLLFIALGFFLKILTKKKVLQFSADAILGFGFLFYGLHLMSQAMYPLRSNEEFINLLIRLENPILGILTGFIFTALIQSSGAFIGILIVLSSQGLLTLEAGIPLLLGSNIGTTITALVASFNAGTDAKRVSFAFFIMNLLGVLLIFWWIPVYAKFIEYLTALRFSPDSELGAITYSIPRQIANAHTIFNIFVTIILLPFSNSISSLIIRLIPEKKKLEGFPLVVQYLDNNLISSPAIAISLAKKETLLMAEIVKDMLDNIIHPFIDKKGLVLEQIVKNEQIVDFYRKEISTYATKTSQQAMDSGLAEESYQIIYVISELEEIGDIISNTLYKKANDWLALKIDFSEEGKKELMGYHFHTVEQLTKTVDAFKEYDIKTAAKLKKQNKKLRTLVDELKRKHFERLSQNIPETIQSSKIHIEVIGALRMINSHIANIARAILKSS